MKFRCTQCGACCTGEPGYVWLTREDILRISEFLGTTPERFAKRYLRLVGKRVSLKEKTNGDCVFFLRPEKKCAIYPVRPVQCRTYPFWPEILRSASNWEEEASWCPGINKGAYWPAARCSELARETAKATRRTARSLPK